jgi:hypothetical protein
MAQVEEEENFLRFFPSYPITLFLLFFEEKSCHYLDVVAYAKKKYLTKGKICSKPRVKDLRNVNLPATSAFIKVEKLLFFVWWNFPAEMEEEHAIKLWRILQFLKFNEAELEISFVGYLKRDI